MAEISLLENPYHSFTYPRAVSAPWRFDALLIALFPLIQIGFSFWISAASLAAALTIGRLRSQLVAGFKRHPWVLALPPVMFAPLLLEFSLDPAQDLLRSGREALTVCLMFWIITGSAIKPISVNFRRITQCITLLSTFLLFLTAIQFVLLRRGVYFGFPDSIFALETGTLPTELDLLYSSLRPAATFAEPSYLAFVILSLLLVLAAEFECDRKGRLTLAITTFTGLLSQAFSFFMFGTALAGMFGMRIVRGPSRLFVIPILLGLAPLILSVIFTVFGNNLAVIDRIQNLSRGAEDFSIFVRILGPLSIMSDYISQYLIGLPYSTVLPAISGYAVRLGINPLEYLMNGMFNILFQYGIFGLVILSIFLIRRDIVLSIYILSCMLFNGSFLQTDKLSIVCLSIALYEAIKRKNSSPEVRG